MENSKLLIIRFSALGDVAMLVPVVKLLAEQYPTLQITVLSKPFAKVLFEGMAPNVHFMGADVKRDYKGIKGLRALYRRLFAKHFTHIADCHDVLRTMVLRLQYNMSHKKIAHIDKHRDLRWKLLKEKPRNTGKLPTAFENYAEVFGKVGFPIELKGSRVQGFKGSRVLNKVGIAPFAAHEGKVYPLERMKEVVDLLIKREPDCQIYFFGSGDEEFSEIEKLIDGHPQCHNGSKECGNLGNELELMKELDVMLTMDSANMHLASIAGTRVVSVWGATHHYAGFYGWGQNEEDIVEMDLPCRPCSIFGNKKCQFGDYRCLKINPEMIINKIFMHK